MMIRRANFNHPSWIYEAKNAYFMDYIVLLRLNKGGISKISDDKSAV